MVKNSLMLFSPSPKSLSKLIVGHTFSQKVVEAGYWVHYTPIITRTPSSTSTSTPHTPYTHHTPAIHHPIPLLLRVDSDEMRCWTARKGPRMGPKVHEVDSARSANKALGRFAASAGAQTKVDEVYGPYGSSPNPAEFAPSKFP